MANRDREKSVIPRWIRANLATLAVLGLFAAIVGLWLWVPSIVRWWFSGTESEPDDFGAIYDAVNALFSGLAFAGVILAVWLQRKELVQTREVLTEQMEQLRAQNETLQLQNFDDAFFQLLRFHADIAKSITHRYVPPSKPGWRSGGEPRMLIGRDALDGFYKRLQIHIQNLKQARPNVPTGDVKLAADAYLALHEEFANELGHYFRNLYNVIKFVDASSSKNHSEKKQYTNLVRAQLSSVEIKLLFFNCMSPLGFTYFKPLVEKYSLLKTLDDDSVINDEQRAHYDPSAFAGSR